MTSEGVQLALGGFLVGCLVGLLPWFVGQRMDKERSGALGALASIVAGVIGGAVLAVPASAVSTLLIRRGTKK